LIGGAARSSFWAGAWAGVLGEEDAVLDFAAGALGFAELAAAVGGWVGVSARTPLQAVAVNASITANRTPFIELIGCIS
jgi:sugar (pentulose or hexulose) kinase